MAPNGATSRKAPPKPLAKSPEKKNEDTSVALANLFDDLQENDTMEVKHTLPAVKKAGNWDNDGKPNSKESSARSSPKPAAGKLPNSVAKGFPNARPVGDKPEMLKCIHCKRAVSKHAMPKHIEGCLNKKQEKQRKKKEAKDARDAAARKEKNAPESEDEEEAGDNAGKKGVVGGDKTGSKKRKAGDDGPEEAAGPAKKKKKKDDGKPRAARPKAPVDVEKQCGVELPQGGQCARSLTCKSHSMGAKRAVPGRSAPYDKLLAEYQRKNQAKLQKAQFDANAPNPDDEHLPTGPVDSDEEKEAVVSSIARSWGGRPICQAVPVPLRDKYRHNRIKGMLQSALGNRGGGNGLFGGGGGGGGGFFGSAPAAPLVDDQGMVHARRGSVVPGARSMMAPAAGSVAGSRKGSLAA